MITAEDDVVGCRHREGLGKKHTTTATAAGLAVGSPNRGRLRVFYEIVKFRKLRTKGMLGSHIVIVEA
jgi:hypothetical protein